MFAPTRLSKDEPLETYDIQYTKEGTMWYTEDGEWELIEDATPNEPLVRANEKVMLDSDSVPNLSEAVESTYGRLLFNWLVIQYAFGTKIPYQQKTTANKLVKMFVTKVVDEPEDGKYDESGNVFYPNEINRFVKSIFELTSLCQYVTPTGSVKTLTTHPDMIATRDALLLQYKDSLDDPAVVAKIQDILIELDKEWLKGDDAEGYYISGKSFSVKRKKMFMMHGIEAAFKENGEFIVIPKSLSEGWDMTQLVAKYNATREGSYNRGADTALGGEKVTFLQRIFQHITAVEGDCGTKVFHNTLLTEYKLDNYMGMNLMVNGEVVELTNENKDKFLGTVVSLRRPILCKLPETDFCSNCLGKSLSKNPRAVAAEIAAVGSTIMYAFMGAMHGVELSVSHFDYNKHLS